jgi:hypothetical protein
MLEVYRNALLAAVDAQKIGADSFDEGKISPGGVPSFRVFYLYYLRPQVAEEHAAKRAGKGPGHVQNPNSFQWSRHKNLLKKRLKDSRGREFEWEKLSFEKWPLEPLNP